MIDYRKIVDAEEFYGDLGFQKIEVPWLASPESMAITTPTGSMRFEIMGEGLLVASGEQSFLHLMSRGELPKGRWLCTTPCFRDDGLDELHKRYFMKVELLDTEDTESDRGFELATLCRSFFGRFIDCGVVETTPPLDCDVMGSTFDLVTNHKIELGSYGVREHPDIGRWVYATGCAEPRLSQAIVMEENFDHTRTVPR